VSRECNHDAVFHSWMRLQFARGVPAGDTRHSEIHQNEDWRSRECLPCALFGEQSWFVSARVVVRHPGDGRGWFEGEHTVMEVGMQEVTVRLRGRVGETTQAGPRRLSWSLEFPR
jgi:hypothetical protein